MRLICALLVAAVCCTLAGTAHAGVAEVLDGWFGAETAEIWRASTVWISARYHEAPELVLGVGAGLALPFLAALGLGLQAVLARRETSSTAAGRRPVRTIPPSAWKKAGQIEVADSRGPVRFDVAHDLIRIGRADDNDIRLEHKTVHRYHAVVERSPDMLFTIVDLSGGDGNGVKVRGVPVTQARLIDGDEFQVGKVSLRFLLTEVR
jgi:hypothetical protein